MQRDAIEPVDRPAPPAGREGTAVASSRRVRRALAGVLALLLGLAALALYGVTHLSSMTRTVVVEQANDLHHAQELRLQMERIVAANRAFVLTRDPMYVRITRAAEARFHAALARLPQARMTPVGRQLLGDVAAIRQRHAQAVERLWRAPTPAGAVQVFEREVAPLTRELQTRLEEYRRRKQALLEDHGQALLRDARRLMALLAAVAVASVLIGLGIWAVVDRALRQALASERGLRQAVSARDAFLAAAGHELRTPLAVLKLNVQLLARHAPGGGGAVMPVLPMLERNVDAVVALVDRMLDVSLIDRNRLKLEPADVDLGALVHEAVERASPLLAGRPCTLDVQVRAPVNGRWDPVRIRQVVDNLVGNAVRHACDGPITLIVERDGGIARLCVSDSGPGLAPESRDRVFERFVSLAPHIDGGGLGIGLSIARAIVEAHGGTIRVEGAPGGGACFIVELPVRD